MPSHPFGVEHVRAAFARAAAMERAAFMPYLAVGHPSYEATLELIPALEVAGADLMEIGMPFSDPLADGPTIQAATQHALSQGITVHHCLKAVHEVRQRGVQMPLLLMGYINPILAYGVEPFCQDAADAGVDGFIIPDLPPEEGEDLQQAAAERNLAVVYLLAPTSTAERVRLVCERSTGFVYLVSVTGITGAREQLPADLADFVARVRNETDLPLAIGFGVSTPEHARRIAAIADGVVVGSALVKTASQSDNPVRAVSEQARALAAGCKRA